MAAMLSGPVIGCSRWHFGTRPTAAIGNSPELPVERLLPAETCLMSYANYSAKADSGSLAQLGRQRRILATQL